MSRRTTRQEDTGSRRKPEAYPLTIREVREQQLEQLNKEKKELSKWSLHRTPTPTKRIKSVETLKKKVNEFFDNYEDEIPPTPTQLAMYLGYNSAADIYREIKSTVEPEYAAVLERAIDHIKDSILRLQMKVALEDGEFRGFDTALTRLEANEAKIEGLNPIGGGCSIGGNVNIQINMEQKEKLSSLIDDSIASVMQAVDLKSEES